VNRRHVNLAALGLAIAAVAGPGAARAATVQVAVDGSTHAMVFEAAPGEVNAVTLGVVAVHGNSSTYSVSDSMVPLSAGSGCSGGGPAGSVVTCQLPRSAPPCGSRGCQVGPGISIALQINLGDADDSLDSTAIPASDRGAGSFRVRAAGGPGADGLVDGPNHATFTPGPGADSVTAGAGRDWAFASEGAADEADLYDLGLEEDTIDYSVAAYPVSVSLAGTADNGAAGEGDRILGAERVRGGSAADVLTGTVDGTVSELFGFEGDDTIVGGPHYDLIEGGPGDDVINGLDGNDHLDGDGVIGATGDDRVRGGDGNDFVLGRSGEDRLNGGSGSDEVFGSTSVTRDHALDRIDCGPGFDDEAHVGREDRVRRCERGAFRARGASRRRASRRLGARSPDRRR
jgi:Ca2+-binding RTX toxin-like protein